MSVWILDATTKSITITMTGAAATTNPDWTSAWADDNGTTVTPGSSDGTLNGTTPVTVVAAPAASTQRIVKEINVHNVDTAAVTFYVKYVSGGTRILKKVTLQVDETFTITNNFDSSGAIKTAISTVPAHGHTGSSDGGTLTAAAIATGQLAVARGGTGLDGSATGGSNQIVKQSAAGGNFSVGALTAAELGITGQQNGTNKLTTIKTFNFIDFTVEDSGSNVLGVWHNLPGIVGGRLTLTTGVPVTTSNVTAAGTLYYTPYIHDKIALYDGTRWRVYTFTEISLSLTLTSGNNYDVFLYDNAGTLTLETLVWTNDTTRATALALTNGVWLKTGALTRRYLGTIRASGTNTTEDSDSKRYVFNINNQVPFIDFRADGTDSWTNAGNGTLSAMNSGNAAWKHEFVVGLNERPIEAYSNVACGIDGTQAIALDSSTTLDRARSTVNNNRLSDVATIPVFWSGFPGIGYHYLQAMQTTRTASTVTFYGDNGASLTAIAMNSGLTAKGWR